MNIKVFWIKVGWDDLKDVKISIKQVIFNKETKMKPNNTVKLAKYFFKAFKVTYIFKKIIRKGLTQQSIWLVSFSLVAVF